MPALSPHNQCILRNCDTKRSAQIHTGGLDGAHYVSVCKIQLFSENYRTVFSQTFTILLATVSVHFGGKSAQFSHSFSANFISAHAALSAYQTPKFWLLIRRICDNKFFFVNAVNLFDRLCAGEKSRTTHLQQFVFVRCFSGSLLVIFGSKVLLNFLS
jgi:hypothetical protein